MWIKERLGRIKYYFKQMFLQKIKFRKLCEFGRRCSVSDRTFFEGENQLASGVWLDDTVLGFASYVSYDSCLQNAEIGKYTCIGQRVRVVVGEHPTHTFVSVHPIFFRKDNCFGPSIVNFNKFQEIRKVPETDRNVVIGNDVWIGSDVNIRGGVKIGDGAVIAASAFVAQDVPPYAIVGGVPAKVIRYRFDEEKIKYLLNLKWWDKDFEWIKQNCEMFDDINRLMNGVQ